MAEFGSENSFVKQSLADTLTGTSTGSRLIPKPSVGQARRLLSAKDAASRKTKATDEAGGILKSLGLAPTPRRRSQLAASDKEAVSDWEQVEHVPAPGNSAHDLTHATPRAKPALPSGPEDFLNGDDQSTPLNFPPRTSGQLSRQNSSKSMEPENMSSLRRKLAESQKARDELAAKCSKLERELNEARGNKTRADGKVLGAREYEELERQFDAQEKLLSGYQRENERSLIELEATKVKMGKMSGLLAKVYGPDWEESILSTTDGSPIGTLTPSHPHPVPLPATAAISSTPSEKLSVQLAQVQLLVQGMERRLVGRSAELEDLQRQAKQDHQALHDTCTRIGIDPNASSQD